MPLLTHRMEVVISTGGQEQRLTFRLLSYWNRIRGTRAMPALSDVNISEITEIWHFTFTIDLVDPHGHRFQYFGPSLASVFGQDYTGEYLADVMEQDGGMLANTIGFYDKVVEKAEPALEAASFFSEGNEVRYRSIIVPLSSDGKTIDYLLGTTNYKVFTQGE